MSEYGHDDAMQDLDWLGGAFPTTAESIRKRNNIADYITRIEAERDEALRVAESMDDALAAVRNHRDWRCAIPPSKP